jgi:hypothetical protein
VQSESANRFLLIKNRLALTSLGLLSSMHHLGYNLLLSWASVPVWTERAVPTPNPFLKKSLAQSQESRSRDKQHL